MGSKGRLYWRVEDLPRSAPNELLPPLGCDSRDRLRLSLLGPKPLSQRNNGSGQYGGADHWNDEAGGFWLDRIVTAYPKSVWLNPGPERHWQGTESIGMIRETMAGRMFPLTLDGLDHAMRRLIR